MYRHIDGVLSWDMYEMGSVRRGYKRCLSLGDEAIQPLGLHMAQ